MRYRPLISFTVLAVFSVSLTSGCDKAKPAEKEKAATADDKAAADKAAADKAQQDAKAAAAEPVKPEAKHFDVSADKSGILARSASVLQTTDQTSGDTELRGHLAELSHHAEALSSDETLCQHVIELRKAAGVPEGDLSSCVTHFEHEVVILGPEVFAQMAQCVKEAKDVGDLDICEAAEQEAELLLHDQRHGDSLSPETCEQLFVHFEKVAMEDAGEHAELVKEILEEAKPDVLKACADYGTQVEADCALAAKDMEALSACQSMF
jgi:hypothetical protein